MAGAVEYLLIGHLSADLVPGGRRVLGGTVSFAARVAHAFGLRVGLVTSAEPCEPLLAEVLPYVSDLKVVEAEATTSFENCYGAEGRTQFVRSQAAPIGLADIPREWMTAPLVHLAPIAGEVDAALTRAFPCATTMLTPQGWLRQWDTDGLVRYKRWHDPAALAALDMVVLSEEDIAADPTLVDLYARAARCVVVTRGEHGGVCYHRGETFAYEADRVEVVDVTGAGDVFAASLLAAYALLGGKLRAAVRVAARLATRSVTRPGFAGAPTSEEAQQALAELRND
ncbi:MAG: PfkB family carbohydrate kinase [Aggregatilineales bacterium]